MRRSPDTPVLTAVLLCLLYATSAYAQSRQASTCIQGSIAVGQRTNGTLTEHDCATPTAENYDFYSLNLEEESSLEIRNRTASGSGARVSVFFEGSPLLGGAPEKGDAVVRGRFPAGRYRVYAGGQAGAYLLWVTKADIRYPGLGMQIGSADSSIVVQRVFPKTPAARAGLRAGDRVIAINGTSTTGMSSAAASNLMRGPSGSEVKIRLVHADGAEADAFLRRSLLEPPAFDLAQVRQAAVARFRNECEGGDAYSCYALAVRTYHGVGTTKDVLRAVELFGQACEGNDADGCRNLGILYRDGDDVPMDLARSVAMFERSCGAGDLDSCYSVAVSYRDGTGMTKDFARAAELFRRACEGGIAGGCTDLGVLYARGEGVSKDRDQADALYARGCDGGEPYGCMNLADRYGSGLKGRNRGAQATALYERACDMGLAEGCRYAAINYEYGYGDAPMSTARATAMYARSCAIKGQAECRVVTEKTKTEKKGLSFGDLFRGAVIAADVLSDPTGQKYRDHLASVSPAFGVLAQVMDGVTESPRGMVGSNAGARTGAARGYRTQPMVNMGAACPGFTMENYRTRAFQGGGDTQLFTMCGQAFEYYAAYLNAIRQGYSEGDAMRTYSAHKAAAQNAISFYRNYR